MHDVLTTYWLGEGCQNSFVVFDLLKTPEYFSDEFLAKAHQILLREHKDDALILLPENEQNGHLQMKLIVLEPDQSLAAFCGNGARVVAAYVEKCYRHQYESFSILAHDGDHKLIFYGDNRYGVDMLSTKTNPYQSSFVRDRACMVFERVEHNVWRVPLKSNEGQYWVYFTETSEPHLVLFDELSSLELTTFGEYLNTDRRDVFPQGININRVRLLDASTIEVRTYERGVNRITQACGTGSTSSAVLCRLLDKVQTSTITVQTLGGFLQIEYDAKKNSSIMKGQASLWENSHVSA